jgi:hypothetical protein
VEGSATPTVLASQVHSFFLEIVEGDRLVPLCGYMHDVNSIVVSSVHICSDSKQILNYLNVASEGSEVERSESVLIRFVVYPQSHLLLSDGFLCLLQNYLHNIHKVLKASKVQSSVPPVIH